MGIRPKENRFKKPLCCNSERIIWSFLFSLKMGFSFTSTILTLMSLPIICANLRLPGVLR